VAPTEEEEEEEKVFMSSSKQSMHTVKMLERARNVLKGMINEHVVMNLVSLGRRFSLC
jgi:hypothetical protein